jgi:D-alanyl-D-alanine carboxypeptidase/D-alanyl-D-alanine-endopeptidase (penicillin-binding protein 4)
VYLGKCLRCLFVGILVSLAGAARAADPWVVYKGGDGPGKGKHVVLVSGDEEYRSEETLPQLGKILAKRHGFTCTVLFAIDPKDGTINPDVNNNIPGLEALDKADLMVLFTRLRNLPDEQMKHIVDYVESGRPVVGLRTATHAFANDSSKVYGRYGWQSKEWPGGFGRHVLGETWVSHHGNHGSQSTRGLIAPEAEGHPILRGIRDGDIWGPTDVYGVHLPDDCKPLVLGQVLQGMKPTDPPVADKKNDPMMPVAWTRPYTGERGKTARTFTTTMGAAPDFAGEGLRRLVVNACYWAVGLEDKIPAKTDVDLVGEFKPTPFGFKGSKKGVKPSDHAEATAAGLAGHIEAVTGKPEYRESRWGILVSDLQSGDTVYERDADRLYAPASVTKLYSCGAALVAVGARHTFETPVYARGEISRGRLRGDLVLVAQGDLCLGGRTDAQGRLAFRDVDHIYAGFLAGKAALTDTDPLAGLAALAQQVKSAGIDRIEGEILIDDRLFAHAQGSGSGPGLLTPIIVNDNLVDVTLTPADTAGQPAVAVLRPQTPWVQVDVQVETVSRGRGRVRVEHVGPQRWVIRGRLPAGGKPMVCTCHVDDPAGFARALFIDCLRRAGVFVAASALQAPEAPLPEKESYARLKRVAAYTSPPLSEYLKVTLKVSHNLYAGTLPLLLAVKEGKRTLAEGMRVQRKVLADLGVDVAGISLESGAGGGNGDRVTPRATVQLLRALAKRPDSATFKAALPVLGVDGTLADVLPADSPARGKAWAKTGTYGDSDLLNDRVLLRSKALAGVVTTRSGRELAFAIFVNEVPQPPGLDVPREGKVLAQLCEILYQYAP